MPGPKPRTRHAEAGPQGPPDIVGGGLGRQRRDVSHRRSRKGASGQDGERREIGELISGRVALHDRRKIAGVEWMVRVVINMSDLKVCGEDNTQFANLLHA